MSDTDNSIDGNTTDDIAKYNAFAKMIPSFFSALGGYRKGWEDRTNGKPMPDVYTWDMPQSIKDTLPVHWQQWWEDYQRGYLAADDRIRDVERLMSNLTVAVYV